jgi:uncharacterized membrane protein
MDAALEALFGFFFKYRPFVFEKGTLALGASLPLVVVLVGLAVVAVPLLSYLRVPGQLRRRDRAILATLRLGALAVLLIILLRPMLVVATVVPQQNFLAVLVDDSRSMQIADLDGRQRGEVARELLGEEDRGIMDELAARFKLRFFRFDATTERVTGITDLGFGGPRTDLSQALEQVRQELEPVPLAGVVVVTDGADNSAGGLTESLLRLKASEVPVYTVGLGRARFQRDVSLGRVETPRSVLEGSTVVVEVHVTQSGFGGRRVPLQVESEGRIVSSEEVVLPDNGETATVPIQFPASEPGPRLFRFHIPPQPGELVAENNTREALIVVEDARQKILYFEGEPRFELKFIRRAVAEDENLRVVVFLREAENVFRRLDVDDAEELATGFPTTREELFTYRGLILGSVEASFFTQDQLRMIAEFVSERGGGLLMLGGRRSFAEGGYAGTAVADALPVVLERPTMEGTDRLVTELKVEPTPVGLLHPATQIAATLDASTARWAELPSLTSVNPIREVKPGASTLLRGVLTDGGDPLVVLAYQRYGRGRTLALPVQDSWLWQMHAEVALDDLTHERFWQQLLRWLVSSVPDRVSVSASQDRVAIGSSVTLSAEVADSAYLRVNGADVVATVQTPSGTAREVGLEWTVETDGTYQAQLAMEERGLHSVRVLARQGGTLLGENSGFVHVADPVDEYFDAELRRELLERIASETGGRFYTAATVGTLPDDVQYTESGTTVREENDLWDMPIIFLFLVCLVAAEWGYRRVRGLA